MQFMSISYKMSWMNIAQSYALGFAYHIYKTLIKQDLCDFISVLVISIQEI